MAPHALTRAALLCAAATSAGAAVPANLRGPGFTTEIFRTPAQVLNPGASSARCNSRPTLAAWSLLIFGFSQAS